VQVTVYSDWLQPGGSAAVEASASNPDVPTAINVAIAARRNPKLRDTLAETLLPRRHGVTKREAAPPTSPPTSAAQYLAATAAFHAKRRSWRQTGAPRRG